MGWEVISIQNGSGCRRIDVAQRLRLTLIPNPIMSMQVAHPAPEVLSMQAVIGESDVTGREIRS